MERKPFPSETQERFIVRFPDGMRDRIAEEAKKNNRSMNAEIVGRLAESLEGNKHNSPPELSRVVSELEALQQLAALNYQLQRAASQADFCRIHLREAWNQLQDALKDGTQEEQKRMRDAYDAMNKELARYAGIVDETEAAISAVHMERKALGLKELRDVVPVSVSTLVRWNDAAKPGQRAFIDDAKGGRMETLESPKKGKK